MGSICRTIVIITTVVVLLLFSSSLVESINVELDAGGYSMRQFYKDYPDLATFQPVRRADVEPTSASVTFTHEFASNGTIAFKRSGPSLQDYGKMGDIKDYSRLVLAGQMSRGNGFSTLSNGRVRNVVSFTSNGVDPVWEALGQGLSSTVNILYADPSSNTIYAGGAFKSGDVNGIASFCLPPSTPLNTTDWQPMGSGVNGAVLGIAVASNGTMFIGGAFSRINPYKTVTYTGTVRGSGVAMWDATSGSWAPLQDLRGSVNALIFSAGYLVAGGSFSRGGPTRTAKNLAVYQNDGWQTLGDVSGTVNALISTTTGMYVGGAFTKVAGQKINHVAYYCFSSSTWIPLNDATNGEGVNGVVEAFGVYQGLLLIGGAFTKAGTLVVKNLVMWDGRSFLAPDGLGFNGPVYAFYAYDSFLYIGGRFTRSTNGTIVNNIVRYDGTYLRTVGDVGVSGSVYGILGAAITPPAPPPAPVPVVAQSAASAGAIPTAVVLLVAFCIVQMMS